LELFFERIFSAKNYNFLATAERMCPAMAAKKANGPQTENSRTAQFTTIKIRLYPNEAQAELFEKTFGCCRYIWNQMLADERRFYLETDRHFIPTPAKYKNSAPFLREVDNQALTQEYNQLAQAFRAFFKNPECFGYPKFKRKKDGRDSFTACNHDFASGPTIYTTRDGIRMTKAGVVKATFHRRPQAWWKLKRITVSRSRTGKYYCAILYACPVKDTKSNTLLFRSAFSEPSSGKREGVYARPKLKERSQYYGYANGPMDRVNWRKEIAMLSLQLKSGDYVTIGEDIVIQVFTNSTIKMSVQAPKDMTILRGDVRERNGGERPVCLFEPSSAKVRKDRNMPQVSPG